MTDLSDYCRQLESYLCRKNGGHLVRIAGPAFEQVLGWAKQGVPLTVAYRGIDRYCERLQARGGSRRPVRIEFCEGDILDIFDDWRRSVGVLQNHDVAEATPAKAKTSLAAHLERVVARLVASREQRSPAFEQHVASLLAEIDRMSGEAKKSRGDTRNAILDRLAVLDRDLVQVAAAELGASALASARREAEGELASYGARLAPAAKARAAEAVFERLVREALGLPTLRYQ